MHICVDGEYLLTVQADFWYTQGIASGDDVSQARLEQLCHDAQQQQALARMWRLLANRDHSRAELARKLGRTVDAEAVEHALAHAESLGYLDDERYAQKMAEMLMERKGMAPRRIRQELLQRGVAAETVASVLAQLNFDAQERLNALLETRFCNKLQTEKDRRRTFDTLLRLGYAYAEINAAMQDDNWNDGGEWDGI